MVNVFDCYLLVLPGELVFRQLSMLCYWTANIRYRGAD
jgi:hypothetical protein